MNRQIIAALIAIAATSAISTSALARTDPASDAVSAAGSDRVIRFSLDTVTLESARPTVEPTGPMRVARNDRRKRNRARRMQPAQGLAQTSDGNANTQAPLDCSIQSHPDCQPKPTAPKSHDYIGNFNFKVEIDG